MLTHILYKWKGNKKWKIKHKKQLPFVHYGCKVNQYETNAMEQKFIQAGYKIVKFNEKIATMLSCKLAIKANENITITEMEYLINDLRKCDNPFNCPHGRPTVIFYSNYDLEKLFKRSGF